MICIIALIVFSILGIFSATHRTLAKEAFDCVLRRVTFRPCTTGFNEKIKGKIVGKLLSRSVTVARVLNKHFELISWVFVILTVGSTFFAVKGVYNFYLYGSCNGLNKSGFCVFDPAGANNQITAVNTSCSQNTSSEKNVSLKSLNLSDFPQLRKEADKQIVFMGCYACDYTRKTYPLIKKLSDQTNSQLIFIHVPAKEKTNFISKYVYCANKEDGDKFWTLNDRLFSPDMVNIESDEKIQEAIKSSGYDLPKILACTSNSNTQQLVDQQINSINHTGVYGTPTILINDQIFVGPKPYRVYERALKGWRFW
ncbi:DsbA family protein [Patescibacteria group bacterium]|nr:DsbA family protein [Patescibacteria group bacterium]